MFFKRFRIAGNIRNHNVFQFKVTPDTFPFWKYCLAFPTCEFLNNLYKITSEVFLLVQKNLFPVYLDRVAFCVVDCCCEVRKEWRSAVVRAVLRVELSGVWVAEMIPSSMCVTFHKSVCPAQLRLADFQILQLHWSLVNKTPAAQPPAYIDLQRALQTIVFVRSPSTWLCFQLGDFQLLPVPVTQGFHIFLQDRL